jgi:predicted amidohydrolase
MTTGRSLAAAQTVPIRGDVDANVEQHIRLVRHAAQERPQVLVFPELSLTGYELDLARDLAFSEHDPRLAPLVDAASAHAMTLIVGAPVRIEAQLYIGAFIVTPERTVEVYTKHHLGAFSSSDSPDGIVPPAEDSVFQPGERNPLVHFNGHCGAVSVCADSHHRSHPERAAARGARTYFSSQFAIPLHLELKIAVLKKRALRHSLTIVLANFAGHTGGLASAGGSGIWTDKGERVAQLEANGSGVVVAVEDGTLWRATTHML